MSLSVDGTTIERVYENTFLGVIIDDKSNWKPHVKYISNKLSRSIAVLNKVKHILDVSSLRMLYCALVLPYLNYCSEVWGNTYKSTLNSLIILQKKAIRIINKAGYRDNTNILFLKSNLLKFIDIVEYKTAILMHRARYNNLPGNIQKMFKDREGEYGLRREFNFKTQCARSTLKSFCLSVRGVRTWNGIDEESKQCSNVYMFKKRLKKKIIGKYMEVELQ